MFGSHPWLTHFVLSVRKTRSFEAEMSLEWPQDCVQLALDWPIVVRLADCHLIGNNAGWMQGDMFLAAWLPIQQDWRWSKGLAWIGWDCKETLCNVNIVNLFHNLSGMTLHLRLARHWLVGWQCRANCERLGEGDGAWWSLVQWWGISGLVQITLYWDTSLHPYRGLVLWLLT